MTLKLLPVIPIVAGSLLALAWPAAAGPCADVGLPGHSEFGRALLAPLAQAGMMGAGGHIPGAHHDYSLGNPSVR